MGSEQKVEPAEFKSRTEQLKIIKMANNLYQSDSDEEKEDPFEDNATKTDQLYRNIIENQKGLVLTEELANQDQDEYVEEVDKGDLIETISQSTKLKFKRTFSIMSRSNKNNIEK